MVELERLKDVNVGKVICVIVDEDPAKFVIS
jgi:hypothetical protein